MKTLLDFNFKNKLVLVRSDLNSDVIDNKVIFGERIKESSKTIIELKRKGARIAVLAHQGRYGQSDFISLKQHAKFLNKITKIKFVEDIIGKKAIKEIKNLKQGEALLLENIRFLKDEFTPNKKNNRLIKKLVPLFDFYVNDSFSVTHRKHTSIIGFPKYLPSCAGKLLEKEISVIKKIKLKNCLYILGGAKPEDNIKLLNKNKILATGFFGNLAVISKGKNLGKINGSEEKYKSIIKKIKENKKNIISPIDFAIKINGKRREISLEKFPNKNKILDIGKKTIEIYLKEIRKAKSVYVKGPSGFCEYAGFCKGTSSILKEVAKIKGFSLIGGGHLNDAIKMLGINKKKFGYVSLSGGALLRYLAGEKLLGIEVLK